MPLARLRAWIRYLIGLYLVRRKEYNRAARQFERALECDPTFIGARRYLAWMLSELEQFDEAVVQYKRVLTEFPEYGSGYYGLAYALQSLARQDEAIAAFRAASERDPHNALIYVNMASCYLALGQKQDALVACRRAARLKPGDATVVGSLGTVLAKLGHWEEAVDLHRQALAMQPRCDHAYNLGIGLTELKRLDEAEQAFRTALRLDPGAADAALNLASMFQEQSRLEEAIAVLNELPVTSEYHVSALSILTDVYLSAGRVDDALRTARSAVEQYPNDATSHAALGSASVDKKDGAGALIAFDEALRLAPGDVDYQAGRAVALTLLSRHFDAVREFEAVLARDPDYLERYPDLTRHLSSSRDALSRSASTSIGLEPK
jgi:protein O-GlcNAc transferase